MAEVILALDLPGGTEALRLLDQLAGRAWVKVGSILMTREGPVFIRTLIERGLQVFLDLKWHDIPNTVAGAVAAARDSGSAWRRCTPWAAPTMMEAAAAAAGDTLALVGVTVLTSHDAASLRRGCGASEVWTWARRCARQAKVAATAGLAGVVCSPAGSRRGTRRAWGACPHRGPGHPPPVRWRGEIRRGWPRPKDAVEDGATHLVVGRPVLQASDPAAAFQEFVEEARCAAS